MNGERANGERVLVTGASGFVGGHLCAALREAGYVVRAAVRGDARAVAAGESAVVPDAADRAALRAALHDVQRVVHAAGRAHVLRERAADPLAAFRQVNVEGTRALLEAAAEAGVRRVVLISSVAAVASASATPINDATPCRPTTPYGISKLEADEIAREFAATGLDVVTLRPPLIYGPGMKGNPLRLFDAVARGLPMPAGTVGNRRSLMYLGNVAAAVRVALAAPMLDAAPYLIGDVEVPSTAELVRAVAGALGRRPWLLPIPAAALRAVGAVGDVVRRVVPVPISSDLVERFTSSLVIDASRFARDAGFSPPHTLEEGLRATATWYRSRAAGAAA